MNFSFSYSRWSAWDECPAKYKYKHIDKLPEPKSPAMAKGIEVHRQVAEYLESKTAERPDSLKRFTALADGLRESAKHGMCKVERQVAFDKDQKRVEWFGKNAYWRFIWDVMAFNGRGTEVNAVDWKGLAVDTLIPTPGGFVRMGELKVGDLVFAPDGTPTRITGKSEVKRMRCFEIGFDTNADPIVCDEEHLWEVREPSALKTVVIPVTELHVGHRIRLADPIQTSREFNVVHPYVLGCWLGDGHARDGMISKPDAELFDHIEACGYEVLPIQPSSDMGRTVVGLRSQLRRLGVLGDKHIPSEYQFAIVDQRRALVQGLMDTDGTWNKTRRRAVFTSVDESFARRFRNLVASLGERATLLSTQRTGFGKRVTAWEVHWTPLTFNPFRLSRKAALVTTPIAPQKSVAVKYVKEVPSVPTQCIAVDHPTRMYLAGRQFIPTHNTGQPRGSYDAQMQIFAIPAYWMFEKLETFKGHLVYLDTGDVVTVEYDRAQFYGPSGDPAAKDGLYGLWMANVAMMESDRAFRPKPSRDACRFCHFHKAKGGPCEAGY